MPSPAPDIFGQIEVRGPALAKVSPADMAQTPGAIMRNSFQQPSPTVAPAAAPAGIAQGLAPEVALANASQTAAGPATAASRQTASSDHYSPISAPAQGVSSMSQVAASAPLTSIAENAASPAADPPNVGTGNAPPGTDDMNSAQAPLPMLTKSASEEYSVPAVAPEAAPSSAPSAAAAASPAAAPAEAQAPQSSDATTVALLAAAPSEERSAPVLAPRPLALANSMYMRLAAASPAAAPAETQSTRMSEAGAPASPSALAAAPVEAASAPAAAPAEAQSHQSSDAANPAMSSAAVAPEVAMPAAGGLLPSPRLCTHALCPGNASYR